MAVSIRRERLDDGKDKDGMQFSYRVTFRTSQVTAVLQHTPLLLRFSSYISIRLLGMLGRRNLRDFLGAVECKAEHAFKWFISPFFLILFIQQGMLESLCSGLIRAA